MKERTLLTIPEELERRQALSSKVLNALDNMIEARSVLLSNLSSKCCVYITGSLARKEIDEWSDLDLFVVDHFSNEDSSALTYVEQSHLISILDQVRAESIFQNRRFSRGGGFLHPIPFADMVAELGDPQDDGKNLFTARMLLLINSTPLVNDQAYEELKSRAIDAYWRGTNSAGELTMRGPEEPHKPIMFMNDLRRWWLTVALNFERYNNHAVIADRVKQNNASGIQDITLNPVLDRRLANLKLRYARMLGVFSIFAGILALESENGITRTDFTRILFATPVERLVMVANQKTDEAPAVQSLIVAYDKFLQFVKGSKEDVAKRLLQESVFIPQRKASYNFHAEMAALVQRLGEGSQLLDYVLI